jgi:hypothetical protein
MKHFCWQKLLIGLALATGCMFVGATIPVANLAHGEVTRGAPEPPAFQNGSVPILREILVTLRQMDGRMARLEALAQRMAAKSAISAQRGANAEQTDESSN